MPFSRFFEDLPLLEDHQDKQVGICLMGPIGEGDNIVWMSGWAWQEDGGKLAASTGDSGKQVKGAHKLGKNDKPPFKAPKPQWMVQTGFRKGSADYNPKKPVLVQVIALVELGGQRAIVQWGQAVRIKRAY